MSECDCEYSCSKNCACHCHIVRPLPDAPREPVKTAEGPKVKLKFMVDPEYLQARTEIDDAVRVIVIDPEAVFLMGILGDSGREMVKAGFPFYFERPLAEKLIKAGFAKEESAQGVAQSAKEVEELKELVTNLWEWMDEANEGCDCGTDELGSCAYCQGSEVRKKFYADLKKKLG